MSGEQLIIDGLIGVGVKVGVGITVAGPEGVVFGVGVKVAGDRGRQMACPTAKFPCKRLACWRSKTLLPVRSANSNQVSPTWVV